MAVLSKKEFLAKVNAIIGENLTDENISLLEDFTDTFNSLETSSKSDEEDWKARFEENDKKWRDRYVARFSGELKEDTKTIETNKPETVVEDDEPVIKYEDIFKEVEK